MAVSVPVRMKCNVVMMLGRAIGASAARIGMDVGAFAVVMTVNDNPRARCQERRGEDREHDEGGASVTQRQHS